MNSNANPASDPANNDSLTGLLKHTFNKLLQTTDDMLPAKIIAFDRTTGLARVQPLIYLVDSNGNQHKRAQIASVPVLQIGGGGFFISFPIKPGDLGWIKANDRDISQFLRTYDLAQPPTFRIKTFSDALFIPGILTGYTIAGEDTDNLTIQNLAGTIKIALGDTTVKVTSPAVEFTGAITIDGLLTLNNGLSISGGITPNATGNLFINGNISATGDITPHVPP